jgi:hypothetical protein
METKYNLVVYFPTPAHQVCNLLSISLEWQIHARKQERDSLG